MKYIKLHSEVLYEGKGEDTVLVLGWSSPDVLSKISSDKYCVAGNLFNAKVGVELVLRNLLANPHVTRLISLRATKFDTFSGSVKALTNFFRGNWGEVISSFSSDLSSDYLKLLRNNIDYYEVDSLEQLNNILQFPSAGEKRSEVITLPFPQEEAESLSTELTGARVEEFNIPFAWLKLLQIIQRGGQTYPTRYGHTMREVTNLVSVIRPSPDEVIPSWVPISLEEITEYQKSFFQISPEKTVYTYGDRMRYYFGVDQITQVVWTLSSQDSRSAVMNLWDVNDHENSSPPCLTNCNFRLRNGLLHLTAVFRSHDIWGGYLLNAYGLKALQENILSQLHLQNIPADLGTLTILSQSAHYYSPHNSEVNEILKAHYSEVVLKSAQLYYDPVGNFVITLRGRQIQVSLFSPPGVFLKKWEGRNFEGLTRKVITEVPTILPAHAAYLGRELTKAGFALRYSEPYIQDC